MGDDTHTGSCLCGAVRITVEGELHPPDACHCSQCRRWSGHVWASTDIPRERVAVTGVDNVTWYASSERVRRGFCRTCGSVLFWDPPGRPKIAVAMGAFDKPTGTHLEKHIFVGDKGDYYEIADGLPQEAP
ncbi:MAG TPA: GFA family protein [Caulobacteraceae bacterium]